MNLRYPTLFKQEMFVRADRKDAHLIKGFGQSRYPGGEFWRFPRKSSGSSGCLRILKD